MRSSSSRTSSATAAASAARACLLLAQLAALGLRRRRLLGLALLVQQADLLGQRLDLHPHVVTLGPEAALPLVEVGNLVDVGGIDAAAGERGLDHVGLVRIRRMSSMGHRRYSAARTPDYGDAPRRN